MLMLMGLLMTLRDNSAGHGVYCIDADIMYNSN